MKKTQKERILEYLKINKKITSLECAIKLKIVDLQHPIMELIRDGYKITSVWKKSDCGNHYKIYYLEEGE